MNSTLTRTISDQYCDLLSRAGVAWEGGVMTTTLSVPDYTYYRSAWLHYASQLNEKQNVISLK